LSFVESDYWNVMLLSDEEDSMARRGYPAEFRRRVLDLLAAGRGVGDVAATSASAIRRCTTGDVKRGSTADSSLG